MAEKYTYTDVDIRSRIHKFPPVKASIENLAHRLVFLLLEYGVRDSLLVPTMQCQ